MVPQNTINRAISSDWPISLEQIEDVMISNPPVQNQPSTYLQIMSWTVAADNNDKWSLEGDLELHIFLRGHLNIVVSNYNGPYALPQI